MTYDWDTPKKVKLSNNFILNKFGDLCGLLARPANYIYYRWGTFYTFDGLNLQEEIDTDLDA